MPLQNRVTPFSQIEVSPARGMFMGNRGCLHNGERQLVSTRWRHKAWIICVLNYKGTKRPLMSPGSYTELFFWDEAVAFAAGHRPCALCRRPAFNAFRDCWAKAFSVRPSAKEIDSQLHEERLSHFGKGEYPRATVSSLPNGTFLTLSESPGQPYCLVNAKLYRWSHIGYDPPIERPGESFVSVLTPTSLVSVLREGYDIGMHPSIPNSENA